ncbi:MAG: flagellar type III secretion system protein FliR [Alphaproteobacteria bacterium]|nr:flagellar type III secretion system protein FliR [Alphaproteobacteria bacterium]MBQ9235843.1 flagellar type III secretion system protein FliR [Alphaproteobacteria bacterium]
MSELFNLNLYTYSLLFLRIGAVFMFMPGFSASYINMQTRLVLALSLTLVLHPLLSPTLPAAPDNFAAELVYMLNEVAVGLFLGMVMQMLFFALNFAGSIASQSIGFANAQLFDPAFQGQSMLIESFLSILALTLIFIGDIHHLMLDALVNSYQIFPAGQVLPWGDMAAHLTTTLSRSFDFGFKLGAPFIAFTIIFYSCMGLISRLMPQLNIFFLSLPIQIYLGLGLLFLTIPVIITVFFRYYGEGLYLFGEN